ncbi:MAG TPA: HAMP domain-containing sensor histidine kinase [Gemmataceae bacterium]|jgi:signal transduction histidine kinase
MGKNEGDVQGVYSARLVEMVVRTLRHEIGDLLQSVYSSVAILQERLPRGQTLERTILTDLRGRAEMCKNELDAAHDLVCPLSLNLDWVDLGELAAGIAATFSLRFPGLQIVCEMARPLQVWADATRLGQAGTLLMLSLCQAARSKVEVRGDPADSDGAVEWLFRSDGPAANAEQLSWLDSPFSTTRHARFGLGLAFARRIVELQGGRVTVGEDPQGGFQIALALPPGPSNA